jgi:hypothetical protein
MILIYNKRHAFVTFNELTTVSQLLLIRGYGSSGNLTHDLSLHDLFLSTLDKPNTFLYVISIQIIDYVGVYNRY